MKRAVILFTRVPVPGQTKTRLMPFLSGEECAALHREFIRSASRACQEVDADVLVYYTLPDEVRPPCKGHVLRCALEHTLPDEVRPPCKGHVLRCALEHTLPDEVRPSRRDKDYGMPCGYTPEGCEETLKELIGDAEGFFPQKGEGMGERMSQAFSEVFQKGFKQVLLIGTDIPEITGDVLAQAFRDLEGCDAVINPTEDGGYYLIGLKKAEEQIWDVPHYGTNTVFRDTFFRLERAGLQVVTGKVLRDIDTKEDLLAWYEADRCIHCKACTKHCRFLEKYQIDLSGLAEHRELAYSCFLCGRCREVCPKNIDGARIAVLMRQMLTDRASYKGLLWEKNPYKFANYRKGRKKSVFFPGCNFTAFYPKTTRHLERLMKKHDIGTVYDCCGKPVYELGLRADSEENLERISLRLKAQKVEELIVLCPNCYHFLKDRLGLPVVTIYEKLRELGEGQTVIRKRIPVYYPCPDREKKEMFQEILPYLEGGITELFAGVQCCGLGGCAGVKEPELSKEMAESAKGLSDELYTYCASCISQFRRKGMEKAYHILPLILGIEERIPLGIQPFMNRAGRKVL